MKRGASTGTSIRYWYDARYFETGRRARRRGGPQQAAQHRVPRARRHLHPAHRRTTATRRFTYPQRPDRHGGLPHAVRRPARLRHRDDHRRGHGTRRTPPTTTASCAPTSSAAPRSRSRCAGAPATSAPSSASPTRSATSTAAPTASGFERAAVRALTDAIRNTRGLLKPKEDPPTLDDVLEGMTAVLHVRLPEPQFTSQTKDELSTAADHQGHPGRRRAVATQGWVDDRKTRTEARTVLQKIVDAARVRLTQKQQKDAARRKTALEGASMPPKLVDCRSTGVDRSELFIVEGDSALGIGRMARSVGVPGAAADPGQDPQRAEGQPRRRSWRTSRCAAIVQVLGAGSGRTFDRRRCGTAGS